MKPISKWKAGIWFYATINTVLAPVGMIMGLILSGGNLSNFMDWLTGGASTVEEAVASVAGILIGYGLCVALAVLLWKSEKIKCGNNKRHMKIFIKIGFKGYIKLILFMTVIGIFFILLGAGLKFTRSPKIPSVVEDGRGNKYNVSKDINGNYRVDLGYGKGSQPLRDLGGYYMDNNGNEYYEPYGI